MATYLDQFTAETLPDLDACVVMSDHQVRFTPLGMKRYRERFGRAGIDINRIKTREAFLDALEASFPVEMEAFARQVKANGGDRLEQRYLIALALGDAEAARLEKILSRRNQLGLTVTK